MNDIINTKNCLNCGEFLKQIKGKKSKVFCNSTCRSNYWQKSDRLEKQGFGIDEIIKKLTPKVSIKNNNDVTNEIKPPQQPKTNYAINTEIPPMPIRESGEDAFDYAARKNEWKKKYNQ
jgi:hypothetical protein